MDLTTYLKHMNISNNEGCIHDCPEKVNCIKNTILKDCKQFTVMEIGFHHGHSSEVFLSHPNICNSVISYDIGEWYENRGEIGKKFLDLVYPNKHKIILGDSTITIPRVKDNKYDIIFIDGGHSFETAWADIINCKRFAHENTIVIVDDVIKSENFHMHFTYGPTNAWNKALRENIVLEYGHEEYRAGLGIIWGKYKV
jgi:predicted O-methyltransferase YrrM